MEAETYKLIQTLSKCRFAPATWDKRFVRDMSAKQPDDTLSEKQLLALGTLRYRYSKQILQITKDGMLDHSYGIETSDDVVEAKPKQKCINCRTTTQPMAVDKTEG